MGGQRDPSRAREAAARVVLWTGFFWPSIGGIEVVCSELVRALGDRFRWLVITDRLRPELPPREDFHGVTVHRFPFGASLSVGDLEALASVRRDVGRLLEDFSPDLVHVMFSDPSVVFGLPAIQREKLKIVITLQTALPERRQGKGSLVESAFGKADWVTTVSRSLLEDLRRRVPTIRQRSSVIYNFAPEPGQAPSPLPLDPPILGCVGRLVPQKGFDLALEALAILRRRVPGIRLLIVGDGAERESLERQARELGVEPAVEFRGWVAPSEVPKAINETTLVMLPSRFEGLPLVGIQASLMGRPVVATRVDGNPEIVVDGETGALVPPEDPGAVAAAVERIVADPEEAKRLGRAGRRRAQRQFGRETILGQYEAIYGRLLAAPGEPAPAETR